MRQRQRVADRSHTESLSMRRQSDNSSDTPRAGRHLYVTNGCYQSIEIRGTTRPVTLQFLLNQQVIAAAQHNGLSQDAGVIEIAKHERREYARLLPEYRIGRSCR